MQRVARPTKSWVPWFAAPAATTFARMAAWLSRRLVKPRHPEFPLPGKIASAAKLPTLRRHASGIDPRHPEASDLSLPHCLRASSATQILSSRRVANFLRRACRTGRTGCRRIVPLIRHLCEGLFQGRVEPCVVGVLFGVQPLGVCIWRDRLRNFDGGFTRLANTVELARADGR